MDTATGNRNLERRRLSIVAYTARDFASATKLAAGRRALVFVCPPLADTRLGGLVDALEGADLILFNLHGLPGGAAWFAKRNGPPVAIRAKQLAGLDLSSAVIFVENCYTGDRDNPMLAALQQTGARAIIAGAGINYGGQYQMMGADWLFWALRLAMQITNRLGLPLYVPGLVKRAQLILKRVPTQAARDTSQFTVWRKGTEYI